MFTVTALRGSTDEKTKTMKLDKKGHSLIEVVMVLVIGSDSSGVFVVSWSTTAEADLVKTVRIVTGGPGTVSRPDAPSIIQHEVPDTFNYRVVRP